MSGCHRRDWNICAYGLQEFLKSCELSWIISSMRYLLCSSLMKYFKLRFVFWTLHLYIKYLPIKIIKSQILSVSIWLSFPNKTKDSLNVKLYVCVQRRLSKIERSFQKVLTFWQDQIRWWMVSLWALQNSQISLWSLLNFETDLFVVNMLCRILYCSQISFVSDVDVFNFKKLSIHCSLVIPVMVCHLVKIGLLLSSFIISWYIGETPFFYFMIALRCGWKVCGSIVCSVGNLEL